MSKSLPLPPPILPPVTKPAIQHPGGMLQSTKKHYLVLEKENPE